MHPGSQESGNNGKRDFMQVVITIGKTKTHVSSFTYGNSFRSGYCRSSGIPAEFGNGIVKVRWWGGISERDLDLSERVSDSTEIVG